MNLNNLGPTIYDSSIKRAGIFYNSSLTNSEVKVEILLFWYLVLFPISCMTRLINSSPFKKINSNNDSKLTEWPIKFFYSGTILLCICFLPSFFTAAMVEVIKFKYVSVYQSVSYLQSVFILTICLYFLIFIMTSSCKHVKLRSNSLLNSMYKCLHAPFKEGSTFKMLFYPIIISKMLI